MAVALIHTSPSMIPVFKPLAAELLSWDLDVRRHAVPREKLGAIIAEAVEAVLEYAFGTLGLHRVTAITDARNVAAARLGLELGVPAVIESARRLGVKARMVQYTWSNLVPSLERGTFDIVIASSVLHATRDIAASVRHARSLKWRA